MTIETKKTSSLFSKLREQFVEDVPDAPVRKGPTEPIVATRVGTTNVSQSPTELSPPGIAADPEVLARLEAKLKVATPELYTSFVDQYEGLQDVIPDVGMRLRAALKTSKTTAPQISQAIDTLLGTMTKAATDFNAELEANRLKSNEAARNRKLEIEANLKANQEAQDKLIAEQTQLKDALAAEQAKIERQEEKFNGIQQRFYASHQQILNRLNQQKSRISQT